MDEQDGQDCFICLERLLTASTVLIRYKNPVYPVYPCKLRLKSQQLLQGLFAAAGAYYRQPQLGRV